MNLLKVRQRSAAVAKSPCLGYNGWDVLVYRRIEALYFDAVFRKEGQEHPASLFIGDKIFKKKGDGMTEKNKRKSEKFMFRHITELPKEERASYLEERKKKDRNQAETEKYSCDACSSVFS